MDLSLRRQCLVFRVPMRDPGDASGVVRLIESGAVQAEEIVAIFGKTEGNGCVNDFTRAYAATALKAALAALMGSSPAAVGDRVATVMSGGTEGGLSPHFLVLAKRKVPNAASAGKSLAIGTAFTRELLPEELGGMTQLKLTAEAVRAAMAEAVIEDVADVHFVQVKCPLLTTERIAEAAGRGGRVVTTDTYESMGRSRGASALGVALALGEVEATALSNDVVCRRPDLWSGRASASAGVELMRNEVVVLGNSAAWASEEVIGHRVMQDGIDLPAIVGVLADVGLEVRGQLDATQAARVTAVLAKAEPSRAGTIRGARHIMWDDSDIHASRHARALVGGVAAGIIGRTDLFISGGAEHQGPDGGGPVAVIAKRQPG